MNEVIRAAVELQSICERYIRIQLAPLLELKESPETMEKLERYRIEFESEV